MTLAVNACGGSSDKAIAVAAHSDTLWRLFMARIRWLTPRAATAAVLVCTVTPPTTWAQDGDKEQAGSIDLPVHEVVERYPPYVDFCARQPDACKLQGQPYLQYGPRLMAELEQVSRQVNQQVRFTLDIQQYSDEDYWAIPNAGRGDCEDIALAKRARLVALGYPSAPLRLAFVFDQGRPSAHCVLTVETTAGTYLLDSETDDILHWADSPYNFEARERTDGRWDRYDQSHWRHERATATPR
jgi:predicted transglutaminase-like cysteine proteinase